VRCYGLNSVSAYCLVVAVMSVCTSITIHILFVFGRLYVYQLYIVLFMNTRNICLGHTPSKEKNIYDRKNSDILLSPSVSLFAYSLVSLHYYVTNSLFTFSSHQVDIFLIYSNKYTAFASNLMEQINIHRRKTTK
jgi:hypothetical protein